VARCGVPLLFFAVTGQKQLQKSAGFLPVNAVNPSANKKIVFF